VRTGVALTGSCPVFKIVHWTIGLACPADFVVNLAWDRPSRTYTSKDLATANAFKLIPDDV
jgi:hypothetical protein